MSKQTSIRFNIFTAATSGVGRTSIINRFVQNNFQQEYFPTVGFDYHTLKRKKDNVQYQLKIWDYSSSSQRWLSMFQYYYKNADLVLLIYDVSRIQTFTHVKQLYIYIRQQKPLLDMIIIGTKSDLETNVCPIQVQQFADENNIKSYKVSSKKGQSTTELLDDIFNHHCINDYSNQWN